jgi:glyoxalase/bleomycin resistance protein/dioxygenase superfamily protein
MKINYYNETKPKIKKREKTNISIINMLFESLDFIYIPAPNIEESITFYLKVLGGELLWKIHAYDVWVACVKLSDKEPHILLATYQFRNF